MVDPSKVKTIDGLIDWLAGMEADVKRAQEEMAMTKNPNSTTSNSLFSRNNSLNVVSG